jgi:hypothetical protein
MAARVIAMISATVMMEAMIFFMAKRCAVGLEAHLEDSAGWGKIEWRGYRRCSGRKEKRLLAVHLPGQAGASSAAPLHDHGSDRAEANSVKGD